MNSMVLSVVSIDGSGNGEGLIKVPMLNNIKLGVTLSGIQVAEGGCIVAGRAELSGVDVALLNQQQRDRLAQAYAVFNQALDKAYENADAIAETYNTFAELLRAIRQKASVIIGKINNNETPSKKDLKTLEKLAQKGIEIKKKELELVKRQVGADTSKYVSLLTSWIAKQEQGVACVISWQNTVTPTPKNGTYFENYVFACDLSGLTEQEPAIYPLQQVPTIQNATLAKVFKNANLNTEELSKFEEQFGYFYKEPENQMIFGFLVEKGIKLKLQKDKIFGEANYNRTKKGIILPESNAQITIDNLQHELFHAYQDQIYPNMGNIRSLKRVFSILNLKWRLCDIY